MITYTSDHALRALTIMESNLPFVSARPEYDRLVAILRDPERWHEADDQFSAIRVNITLANEAHGKSDLDSIFAYVAEKAAKTAYNCSGRSAPFDNDSYERLLRCDDNFREAVQNSHST
jgi:hypothetical protein